MGCGMRLILAYLCYQFLSISAITSQLVRDADVLQASPIVVQAFDLHVSSVSLRQLISAVDSLTMIPTSGISNATFAQPPTMFERQDGLVMAAKHVVFCNSLRLDNHSIGAHLLRLITSYKLQASSPISSALCRNVTAISLQQRSASLIITGSLEAPSMRWQDKPLITWMTELDMRLTALPTTTTTIVATTTTATPITTTTTRVPTTLSLTKRSYTISASAGAPTAGSSKVKHVNDGNLFTIWQPQMSSNPYLRLSLPTQTADWIRLHWSYAGDPSRPRSCALTGTTATLTFPAATATNGPWIWAAISPPISSSSTTLTCSSVTGYSSITFSELELYSGVCPSGTTPDTTGTAAQATSNPSLLCR
eukprot:m.293843 g.293843  ORF g.293843 m.293843 type:complete len:365 (-) comp33073_c0_seq1:43-1137(-)